MANERARALRKNLTPQEIKLWMRLRERRTKGYHFRKQSPIKNYIIDFVCFSSKIAIEVDGGQHGRDEGITKDARRDKFLLNEGFIVLRF